MDITKPQSMNPINRSSINMAICSVSTTGPRWISGVPSPFAHAAALIALDSMKANRSLLIKSACVVGMPCGNPG
jgi:hypothetical protein